MNVFGVLIGAKTVDSVLSQFTQAVTDLQEVATVQSNLASKKYTEASAAHLCAVGAEAESKRASTVASKITALISAA